MEAEIIQPSPPKSDGELLVAVDDKYRVFFFSWISLHLHTLCEMKFSVDVREVEVQKLLIGSIFSYEL